MGKHYVDIDTIRDVRDDRLINVKDVRDEILARYVLIPIIKLLSLVLVFVSGIYVGSLY